MLSEKISPAGICRVLGISQRRLQSHVNEKYKHIGVTQLNTAFLKPQSFAKIYFETPRSFAVRSETQISTA
ncbi:MAG: hypothetical protein BWK80_53435 [Desulfobacteraceae bacterium IS3]|nr:MAG: hypothetical protein BWK80_53435 [Desulfobacteraceae bacterium IS3]